MVENWDTWIPETIPVPTHQRIEWLQRLVVENGGFKHHDLCRPHPITYQKRSVPGARAPMGSTCSCGNDTLVNHLYEKEDGSKATVLMCLVCDGGAHMPVLEGGYE